MLRPTIHGCNFPFRGPKSRTDVSGLLTSARYDICRCIDETARLETRRKTILGYYLSGDAKDVSIEYDQPVGEHDLLSAIAHCEDLRQRGTFLLFGG